MFKPRAIHGTENKDKNYITIVYKGLGTSIVLNVGKGNIYGHTYMIYTR